jgi:hypothetical protein
MFRRTGTVSMIVLTAYLLSGATSPQQCNTSNQSLGPSEGEVIGAAVAVVGVVVIGTVVLVEVHNSHHTIKGCVTMGPSGLQVEDSGNQKIYTVTGVTTGVKVGDVVRLHGNKEKKKKGDPDQGFVIEKISKDYGACKVTAVQAASTAATPAKPAP